MRSSTVTGRGFGTQPAQQRCYAARLGRCHSGLRSHAEQFQQTKKDQACAEYLPGARLEASNYPAAKTDVCPAHRVTGSGLSSGFRHRRNHRGHHRHHGAVLRGVVLC